MGKSIFHDGRALKHVIVVPPEEEYFRVDDLKAHNIRVRADENLTKEQHKKLRDVMRFAGVNVIEIPELEGHPNSVFAMDTSLSLGDSFIKLRMGLPTRRGEDEYMAKILENLGLEKIGEIIAPGTAEGGDLIPAYPIFFIGQSSRTNRDGEKQIAKIAENLGYEARIISVPKQHLHLGGAMTIVGESKVLACKSIPKEKLRDFDVLWLNCSSFISGNVIYLGKGKIIVERRNREAIKILENEGYEVHALNLSEFVKGSGGPSCLILAIERG
jgi:dimethylargininase